MLVDALFPDPLTRLLAQIVAIVALSRILGAVLRRVGQPMVIAEILAGIVLGPTLLGWLMPDTAGALFAPDALGPLQIVSELGLVLFMFVVGLQIDPALLRGQGRRVATVSIASLAFPFAAGALLAPWVRGDAPPGTFALFLGTALSATAFPVLARILAEQRLLGTALGALAVAAAAVGDVVFWCLAAAVVALARSDGMTDVVRTAGLVAAWLAVAFGVLRPALRRLGERVSDASSLGKGVVVAVLLLLFASALLTERIGVNALFGAFVLGVVVPKEGRLAHALATRLEDLVQIVLLPLFYAYSGARTDLRLLQSPGDWILCGGIVALAVVAKLGGTSLAARWTGLAWREAGVIGVLLNTRGLKELILLHIGLDLGLLDESLFAILVLMGFTTTVMTSPLLRRMWHAPPPTGGVDLATTTDEGTFRVLLCVSTGRSGAGLVTLAAGLGAGRPGRPLHALHLLQPTDRVSFLLEQGRGAAAEPGLQPVLEGAARLGITVRPLAFVSTEPAVDICHAARAKEADLVLMGWHRAVVNQTLLGGTVYEVLEGAPGATVGVFVDRGLAAVRRVLVPWGGSPHDDAALVLARRLLRASDATVTVLHVAGPETPSEAEARRSIAEILGHRRARYERLGVADDGPSPVEGVLAACATGYDLVVVGVGRTWGLEQRLIGLYPERLMRDCPVSLLVVRGSTAAMVDAALVPRAATGLT